MMSMPEYMTSTYSRGVPVLEFRGHQQTRDSQQLQFGQSDLLQEQESVDHGYRQVQGLFRDVQMVLEQEEKKNWQIMLN